MAYRHGFSKEFVETKEDMKERDLREPVTNWFQKQGYECAYERFFPSGYCDIVAFRFAPRTSRRIPKLLEIIAIELKLDDVGTALWQAKGYGYSGARPFVAMPLLRCKRMKGITLHRFRDAKIGLLAVGESVDLWIDSDYQPGTPGIEGIQWMKQKLWRIHRKSRRQQ